jgi:hypothetical protein
VRRRLHAALRLVCLVCLVVGPLAGVGCAGAARPAASIPAPAAPGARPEAPAAVLARFVEALEAGRWTEADALLSARWHAAYGPARLAADWDGAGPLAREAAARVARALAGGTPLRIEGGRATLAVAGGQAQLSAEGGAWRVDALE